MSSSDVLDPPRPTPDAAPPQQPRRGHRFLVPVVTVAAVAALAAGGTGLLLTVSGGGSPATDAPRTAAAGSVAGSPLERARQHATAVPQDPTAWSSLGFAALEEARASSDPALYREAQTAFDRSLTVLAEGNVPALAGQAALADARHAFADAEHWARQALAADPVSPVALAALTDALTELGRYPDAQRAAQALDDAQPGVPSFTRLSYQAELRGRTTEALDLLRRAAAMADSPTQVAFCRAQEGLLALSVGDVAVARQALAAGVLVAPDDAALLHLQARISWAAGDLVAARDAYARLVVRRPTPAWATEQGDLLTVLGDREAADTAYATARAGYQLNAGAGVAVDPGQVLFEADHGAQPAPGGRSAVDLGRTLWAAAPSVSSADGLAWALHRSGDDAAALPYVRKALALGERNPATLYRAGAVLAAAGPRAEAVDVLHSALSLDPHAVAAADARAALATLGVRS